MKNFSLHLGLESGMLVEKIVLRNKVLRSGQANSAYICLDCNMAYDSLESFLKDYSHKDSLYEIFGETINSTVIEESDLYRNYSKALESQEDNEDFKLVYKIGDDFALHLTDNIYIYHLLPKNGEIYSSLTPWFYADSKKYMGDTWWEEDLEIIKSFKELSVYEFLKRYKGY